MGSTGTIIFIMHKKIFKKIGEKILIILIALGCFTVIIFMIKRSVENGNATWRGKALLTLVRCGFAIPFLLVVREFLHDTVFRDFEHYPAIENGTNLAFIIFPSFLIILLIPYKLILKKVCSN